MNPRLIEVNTKREFPLDKDEITLGRASDNNIQVDWETTHPPKVSGHHARIVRRDQKFWLEDMGSKNGTFLVWSDKREQQLTPRQEVQLQEGIYIRLAVSGAMLRHEVGVWIALEKHLNIVQCEYLNTLDNIPFMFMEWINGDEQKGNTLRSWLNYTGGPLELRLAMDITIDICRGMSHACQKQPGLVHRDLKPENILLLQDGTAKITDFGLAKVVAEAELGSTVTPSSAGRSSHLSGTVGTRPYMASEQFQRGHSVSCRTDIYAVGCILYEMLTGQLLFEVAVFPFTTAEWQAKAYPPNLQQLVNRCLQQDPAQRFANWESLLAEATACYEQLFATTPKPPPVAGQLSAIEYGNRGLTYSALKRYEEALADYGQAVRLDPTFAKAYSNRGLTYSVLKRYEEALADYEQAVRLDPTFAKPIPKQVNRK